MAKFCLVWFTPSPHGAVCACTEMFCLVAFLLFVFKYVCLYSWRNYICSLGLDPWRLSCMPLLFNPSSLVLAMRAEKKHLPRASLGQNGWKAACLERKKADESFCWRPGGWCRVGRRDHSHLIAVSSQCPCLGRPCAVGQSRMAWKKSGVWLQCCCPEPCPSVETQFFYNAFDCFWSKPSELLWQKAAPRWWAVPALLPAPFSMKVLEAVAVFCLSLDSWGGYFFKFV